MSNLTVGNLSVEDLSNPTLTSRMELGVSVQIGLYSVIFFLSVLGNVLVILTLVQNQGMRTITNLFLLNLAISDLLMGVICIPFTLVSTILQQFIFGAVLCKIIPFLQDDFMDSDMLPRPSPKAHFPSTETVAGITTSSSNSSVPPVSISVSAWTLVAISVERYYAICHPLTSRRWQTLSHAYKIIAVVWILSLFCMSPIAIFNVLVPLRQPGRYKCREKWPEETLEKLYNVFLDIILLVLPLIIMSVKYSLITRTLWQASSNEAYQERSSMLATSGVELSPAASPSKPRILVTMPLSPSSHDESSSSSLKSSMSWRRSSSRTKQKVPTANAGLTPQKNFLLSAVAKPSSAQNNHHNNSSSTTGTYPQLLRRSNASVSLNRKKRVIQMLGVVVAEFFICWTPLFVMNTWYLFWPKQLYSLIGPLEVATIQLVAYFSSCVNPITYCFMNRGFRTSFFRVFGCHWDPHRRSASHRADSLRLTRGRSLYTGSYSNNSNCSNNYKPNTVSDDL